MLKPHVWFRLSKDTFGYSMNLFSRKYFSCFCNIWARVIYLNNQAKMNNNRFTAINFNAMFTFTIFCEKYFNKEFILNNQEKVWKIS